MTKICSICKTAKPATREFYHPDARAKTGCQPECRVCWLAKKRARGIVSVADLKRDRLASAVSKTEKSCTVCLVVKPMSAFIKATHHLDGRHSRCKICEGVAKLATARSIAAVSKECPSCELTVEPSGFSPSRWTKDGLAGNCKSCVNIRVKAWVSANPDWARDVAKKSYRNHRSARIESARIWAKKNPEKIRESSTRSTHRRGVAIRSGLVSRVDKLAWAQTLEFFDNRCAYCLRNDVKLHMDHVIAIARGGDNSPENLVPACRSCNSKKSASPVFMMAGR